MLDLQLLKLLNEYTLNLLLSGVIPKTDNGHKMHPLGKLLVSHRWWKRGRARGFTFYKSSVGFSFYYRNFFLLTN